MVDIWSFPGNAYCNKEKKISHCCPLEAGVSCAQPDKQGGAGACDQPYPLIARLWCRVHPVPCTPGPSLNSSSWFFWKHTGHINHTGDSSLSIIHTCSRWNTTKSDAGTLQHWFGSIIASRFYKVKKVLNARQIATRRSVHPASL